MAVGMAAACGLNPSYGCASLCTALELALAEQRRPQSLPAARRTSSSTTIWSHCAAVERRWATSTHVRPLARLNSAPSTCAAQG